MAIPHEIGWLVILILVIPTASASAGSPLNSWLDHDASIYESFMLPHLGPFQSLLREVITNESIPVSNVCRRQLHLLNHGLTLRTIESMEMISSFSKGHPGFVTNRLSDFGRYDQCINGRFNGIYNRYFLLHLDSSSPDQVTFTKPSDKSTERYEPYLDFARFRPFTLVHSLCLPGPCSQEDLTSALQDHVIGRRIGSLRITIQSSESKGDTDRDPFQEFKASRLAAKTLILTLVSLVVMASFFPSLVSRYPHLEWISCWDACGNSRKVFSNREHASTNLSDPRLHVFNAYKTLYLLVGISAHVPVLFSFEFLPMFFPTYYAAVSDGFICVITMSGLAVNINFVVSGALAVVTLVPIMKRDGSGIPLHTLILARALRTMPVIAFVNLIQVAIPFLEHNVYGQGPLYINMHRNHTGNCVENGWRDVFFVTTSVPLHEMCNIPAWFISVDFKMFLLSLVAFACLARSWNRLGLAVLGVQAAAGVVIHYYFLTAKKVFPPIAIGFEKPSSNRVMMETAYYDDWGYIACYPVGVVLGYCILQRQKPDRVSVPKTILGLLGVVTCMASFASMYDPVTQESPYLSYKGQVLYAAMIRPLFLVSFSWFAYYFFLSCDVVIRVCKSRVFTVGSRISFSAFMMHPVFISYFQSVMTSDHDFSSINLLAMSLLVLVCSLSSGFLVMMLVEYPFANLMKGMTVMRVKNKLSRTKQQQDTMDVNENVRVKGA